MNKVLVNYWQNCYLEVLQIKDCCHFFFPSWPRCLIGYRTVNCPTPTGSVLYTERTPVSLSHAHDLWLVIHQVGLE
jgi:hypothetical protein